MRKKSDKSKKAIEESIQTPKPIKKGVRYIAKKLREYQKRKYPTYKEALAESKKVLAKIKSKDQKVTLKNIWAITRKKSKKGRKKAEKMPYIPSYLLQPNPYFTLLEYDYWLKRCSNKIFFESTVSPSTLENIQGGTTIDADEYFLDFVRYCNILKSQTDPEEDRYVVEWQVLCTTPQKISGKWVSTILCVNQEGEQNNYGFDPDRPSAEPLPPMPTKPTKPTKATKPTKKEPTKKQPTKKAEAKEPTPPKTEEKANAKRVEELNKMLDKLESYYKKGMITKKDFSEKVNIILSKLEKGGAV